MTIEYLLEMRIKEDGIKNMGKSIVFRDIFEKWQFFKTKIFISSKLYVKIANTTQHSANFDFFMTETDANFMLLKYGHTITKSITLEDLERDNLPNFFLGID